MQPEQRKELITVRIEKSKSALEDARVAPENNRYSNASNRIYYSIFHIVSALALSHNFTTSKHFQLLGWFNKVFIHSGIVSQEVGKIYSNAFEARQESDYSDFIVVIPEDVQKKL